MPRKKRAATPENAETPLEVTPAATPPDATTEEPTAEPIHVTDKPTDDDRPKPKLRGVAVEIIGDKRVRLIDNGNRGGVGIKIEGIPEGEKPSEAVMAILRSAEDVKLQFRNDMDKSWMVRVNPMDPSGTRRAVEKKFAAVVEAMRQEAGPEAPPLQ
jgi:hypothetical protein